MSQERDNRSDDTQQPVSHPTPIFEESSIDLLALWNHLRVNRRKILIAGFGCMIVAAGFSLLIPNTYTANASFLTPRSANSGLAAMNSQTLMLGAAGFGGSIRTAGDTYIGLLQSRSIAKDMVSRFNLLQVYHVNKEAAAEKILAERSIFDTGAKNDIMTVSVSDRTPKLARDLTAAYLDELRAALGRLALTESSQRRLFYEQQMAQEKDALENAEVELKQSQEKSGLIAPVQQTAVEVQTVAATQAQIAGREVELAGLLQGSTNQDPAVIRLRSEITDLKGQLARMQHGNGDNTIIPTSKVPSLQLDYVRKQREVLFHETLFDILSKQYEAARLDESHDAPMLQVVDQPDIPDHKSGPHRTYTALGGLLFGLVASSLWALAGNRLIALFRHKAA
ncbi:MAG: Wzz/FepE/Etk N-terminal domain-containing protein [Acidobacteriaceae bacterium]|nr:Wzz/FepE/Etk N-terminal domain-containing protein [Acidobacteriaceae bacterium]